MATRHLGEVDVHSLIHRFCKILGPTVKQATGMPDAMLGMGISSVEERDSALP